MDNQTVQINQYEQQNKKLISDADNFKDQITSLSNIIENLKVENYKKLQAINRLEEVNNKLKDITEEVHSIKGKNQEEEDTIQTLQQKLQERLQDNLNLKNNLEENKNNLIEKTGKLMNLNHYL